MKVKNVISWKSKYLYVLSLSLNTTTTRAEGIFHGRKREENKHLRMAAGGDLVRVLKFKSFITLKHNISICEINPPKGGIDLHEFFKETLLSF